MCTPNGPSRCRCVIAPLTIVFQTVLGRSQTASPPLYIEEYLLFGEVLMDTFA